MARAADEFVTRADIFMPEALWDIRRVARTLNVSTATVRRYTRQGRLRATRLSPLVVRYNPLDVDAFISRGERRILEEAEERKARQEEAEFSARVERLTRRWLEENSEEEAGLLPAGV
jgi:hypothetical protein